MEIHDELFFSGNISSSAQIVGYEYDIGQLAGQCRDYATVEMDRHRYL